jgi:GntR family transcriptional regulator
MGTPLHLQLAESLFGQISDGTFGVGERLPTEEKLGKKNGVARGTVRRALCHLEDLGMISRMPKAGTVVISPSPVPTYQPVAQSSDDVVAFAQETRIKNPKTAVLILDAPLASRIGARSGTEWFVMQGARVLRRGDDAPLCWSEHYLRGDLPREKLLSGDILVEDAANRWVDQTISAGLIDRRMAAALDAELGGAALVITRRNRGPQGELVSVGIHTHPADRYVIETRLH